MAGFDARTGDRVWATPGDGELTLARVEAGAVVAFRVHGGIGLDLADGTLLWDEEADLQSAFRDRPLPVPVDGNLLVGRFDGIGLLDPVTGDVSPAVPTGVFEPLVFAEHGDTLSVGLSGAGAPTEVIATYAG